MAQVATNVEVGKTTTSEPGEKKNYMVPLALMSTLFFMIGFITVLNDVLIPSLKGVFTLNTWQAMLIQFCFFSAYGVMSIPSGKIINAIGYKKGLALALGIIGVGLLLFIPASMFVQYWLFLTALFIIGSGLALLQVAINPYIIALGPAETGASRLNLGGALNSTATFLGPILGGAFILKEFKAEDFETVQALVQAKADAVQGPYLILALITIAIGAVLYFIKLPKIDSEVAEGEEVNDKLTNHRNLIFGAGAIFFYVGVEVAIGSLLILYLATTEMGGIEEKHASSLLAYYWGSAMIGRFIGSAITQKISPEILLRVVTAGALLMVALSFTGFAMNNWVDVLVMIFDYSEGVSLHFEDVHIPYAGLFLVLCGLFNSVMWPSIFPLGIKGLGKLTSLGSGVMVAMVAGGAFIPLFQGMLEESIGFKWSFLLPLFCYAYLFFFAVEGYKTKKGIK
ncbi:sugar MFS transporter [Algivirga pacifica]|uniref:L-fucose:H+ symporter permease n=1 Tax=Algivirga pacifica TaxID=1162670 RepID=A0ABP9D608_9BACT